MTTTSDVAIEWPTARLSMSARVSVFLGLSVSGLAEVPVRALAWQARERVPIATRPDAELVRARTRRAVAAAVPVAFLNESRFTLPLPVT